jgi:long-chain fatty acid transport protein
MHPLFSKNRLAVFIAASAAGLLVQWAAGPAVAQLRPANSGNFASADSAATAYSNPAGMSRLDRRELVLETIAAYTSSQFKVSPGTTAAGGDGDKQDNFIAIPSLYFATPAFHERVRLGFSLNVPSGFGSDYGNDWAGRYVATESSLVYVAGNASASVRVNDWFSLGAGIQLLYTSSTSKSRINNVVEGVEDGQVELEASGIGIGGVVGALFEVDEFMGWDRPLRFGLSYRPKTETDIDGVPELEGVGPILGAALIANGLIAQKIEIKTTSPQRLGLGLYFEPIERFSVALDFLWVDMEQFGSVEVSIADFSTHQQANYRDTYATTISLGWEIHKQVELLAGFAYLTPPIKDSDRSLSLPIDRIYVVGGGVKYRPRDWFELFVAFNYYDTGDSRVDTEPTDRSGRIVGEFSPHVAFALDIGLTYRF